jgi:hypothetical protein
MECPSQFSLGFVKAAIRILHDILMIFKGKLEKLRSDKTPCCSCTKIQYILGENVGLCFDFIHSTKKSSFKVQ